MRYIIEKLELVGGRRSGIAGTIHAPSNTLAELFYCNPLGRDEFCLYTAANANSLVQGYAACISIVSKQNSLPTHQTKPLLTMSLAA